MTHGEIVNRVVNDARLNNIDEHISRRYILSIAKSISKTYIAQRLNDRTISAEYNLRSEIRCIEMELDDVVKCPYIEFRSCRKLSKSVKPLPETIWSRSGAAITNISSIDGGRTIYLVSLDQYRRNRNRAYKMKDDIVAYVDSRNYIYVPDEDLKAINLELITVDTEKIDELDSCKKCKNCKSGWDYEFIAPDKILDNIIDKTINTIASIYKQIQPDENPNLNEYLRQ